MADKEGGAVSAVAEEAIRSVLPSVKEAMKTGDTEVGVLDPLALDAQTVRNHHAALALNVTLSCMLLRGLSDFAADEIRLNVQTLTLTISFSYESLVLDGRYDFKGKLVKVIPLSGRGPFVITAYRPKVRLRAKLKPARGHLQVSTLTTNVVFHDVRTRLDHLTGGSFVSRMLDHEIRYQAGKRIDEGFSHCIKDLLNEELKAFSVGAPLLQLLRKSDKFVSRSSLYS